MNKLILFITIFLSACMTAEDMPKTSNNQPIEIGTIEWKRGFDNALLLSKKQDKPVLALFQEVPGCAGCQKFGKEVLSYPLLVDAIENEFVPVLIYNNRQGTDAQLLKRFKEPSWNYQVIRFLDSSGKDIIPRKDRIWTIGGVAKRMIETLQKANKTVPPYLQAAAIEHNNYNLKEAGFAMYCFWTGEVKLGQIEGVIKTEAGFYDSREITRVWYDPKLISLENLVGKAQQVQCANKVYVNSGERKKLQSMDGMRLKIGLFKEENYSKATSDEKKQIQKTVYMKLGLTDFQLTKVNAYARTKQSKALSYLSPSQKVKLWELTKK